VRVPEGDTILDACRSQGVDTPTLCYAENLTPQNACRVCVVEVEAPARWCRRAAGPPRPA
jgi:NADH dehydrogenase/NADH:ubiquinone oxidoreductase subunit G